MQEDNTDLDLYFCGDIHGELKTLVFNLTQRYKITNAAVIIAGDFGAGFDSSDYDDRLYRSVKKRLEENNITIYAIRGNHDDPSYFLNPEEHNFDKYDRLKLLKDHTLYEIAGRKIYTIGGANSLDVEVRLKANKERLLRGKRPIWWETEDVTRIPLSDLPTVKVDVVVSHEAPLSFSPVVINRTADMSAEVYNKVLNTRNYLNEIMMAMRFNYWIYGHYHKSFSGSYNDSLYRCLDINELFNIPKQEQ